VEVQTVVNQVVAFLAPYLPHLLKAGERVVEETGKKLGENALDHAKALWAKLRPKVEAKPAALEAAQDVVAAPRDEDAQASLRSQLKKLLSEDETLAAEVARLWQEAERAGVTVTTSGDRNVIVGGDVSNTTIATGDHNVVKR
jgi:hypothetical protein